ncbi:MAG: tetratricopeptide repeat protein [Candidatus Marinimicrobia bacterium]|jgi:tetratricopeptide (TPR) repeat protein|nr:tetratricopeptide repeat protein [Candidatus Neomarinimicrobiota bacterium]
MSIKTKRLLTRANKLYNKGEIDQAEFIYKDILKSFSNNKDAKDGLQKIKNKKQQVTLSKDELQSAVSFVNSGNIKEALEVIEPLIEKFPGEAILFNIRGVCNKTLQKFRSAIDDFNKAIMLKAEYAEAHYNLGVILREMGENDGAANAYKKALSINNNYPNAHNNLGQLLLVNGDLYSSIDHLEWAVVLKPDYAEAHNNLGSALLGINKVHDAIKSFKKAASLKPDYATAFNNLGIGYQRLGEFDLAIESFQSAIDLSPGYTTAHHNLSGVKTYSENDLQIIQMESLLANNELSNQDRIFLSFALAKANEDLGNHKELFKHLHKGNKLRKKELNYSITKSEGHNEMIKLFFNSRSIKKYKQLQTDYTSIRPIFIVGMLRSGTSLVEQIISSHSEVYGAGELKNFNHSIIPIIKEHLADENFTLIEDEFKLIRKEYLNSLSKINANEKVITDKWPLNFRSIGFILSAFPQAKIVHLKRDARATCWSIYKHYFSDNGNGWAYNFDDLAKFYSLYVELMNYWHELYPGNIYDISYEELTSNQEKETRKLIEYCGLDWDPNCLNFHENKRDVKTASALQVRKKMYQGSSDAWKEYSDYLTPLNEALNPNTPLI